MSRTESDFGPGNPAESSGEHRHSTSEIMLASLGHFRNSTGGKEEHTHHGSGERAERSHHRGRGSGKHQQPPTYEGELNSYWSKVDAAKHKGELLLDFPPVRAGLDNPKALNQTEGKYLPKGSQPSIDDIVTGSKTLLRTAYHDKNQPNFELSRVDEDTFKQRYAQEAVRIGAQFGISKANMKEMVERIYAFEDGGWGTNDTLSSTPQFLLRPENEKLRDSYHPISSAIGYNQLLLDNSVDDVRKHGTEIGARLDELAAGDPQRSKDLTAKADLMRKLADLKGPLDDGTRRGMHALNLDGDIGPIIQSIELENLIKFARDNNMAPDISEKAARINANAAKFDALSPEQKQAAVDQLVSRLRLPPDVAQGDAATQWQADKDALRQRLLTLPPGESDRLSQASLTPSQYTLVNTQLMAIRKYDGDAGPLSADAQNLMDKLQLVYDRGVSADSLIPAAIELSNLAGTGAGLSMLKDAHDRIPTANYFSRAGYERNPAVARRSAGELLAQIDRIMHGPNAGQTRDGIIEFDSAFKSIPDVPRSGT